MLVKNTTTNTCVFSLIIHEVPEALLEALFGNQTKVGKMLFQKVLEEGVAYWSFMFEGTKSCDLLLRMQVEERDDEEGVVISVESVDDEGERGTEGWNKNLPLTCIALLQSSRQRPFRTHTQQPRRSSSSSSRMAPSSCSRSNLGR